MKKLAIVIPYYKIDYFEACLQSLSKQTCHDFNLYIGDDASPNSPIEIVNKYKALLPSLSYKKFDENLGNKNLVYHWSRCIEMTQEEEWIMIPGDDDMFSENMVETFYNNLVEIEAGGYNVIRNSVIEINGKGQKIREIRFPEKENATDSYIKKITENYHITLPEYIFRKKTYKKYGFKDFPFAFGSDNIAWLEFSENKPIYTLTSSFCYMRLSDINISGNKKNIKEKVYAMYLTKKYIINNIWGKFNSNQKKIILKKGYEELLFSGKANFGRRVNFLFSSLPTLSFKEIFSTFIYKL